VITTVREVVAPASWTVEAETSIEEAARRMRKWGVREVLVTEGDTFCGVLSDSDIIVLAIASGHSPSTLLAGACCDPDVPRLDLGQRVDVAADQMRELHTRHLPVVDHAGRLVGVAWISDLAAVEYARVATARSAATT
jgi:CBS domain-containing protein